MDFRRTTAPAGNWPQQLRRPLRQLLALVLLLGVWPLALAAPQPEPAFSLPHPHASRTAMMNLAAAALAVTRGDPTGQMLDEPRRSAVGFRDGGSAYANDQPGSERPGTQFPIQWRQGPEIVDPAVVNLIRNYHRNGLPIVHLWESNKNLLALGLNPHGVPGLYFTRHLDK